MTSLVNANSQWERLATAHTGAPPNPRSVRLPTLLYFWKHPLCKQFAFKISARLLIQRQTRRRNTSGMWEEARMLLLLLNFPNFPAWDRENTSISVLNYQIMINPEVLWTEVGCLWCAKCNFLVYDVQRITDESLLFSALNVVPEPSRIFKRCWRNQSLSTLNKTVSTVLKDACYTRASLPPPAIAPP